MTATVRRFLANTATPIVWFIVAFMLLPENLVAQTYRWVDADGKTHFSDQPPEHESTRYETVADMPGKQSPDSDHGPDYSTAGNTSVVHSDFSGSSLVVTQIELPWSISASEKTTVGRYYFGKACASATAMVMPTALQQHRRLFPMPAFIGSEIASEFRQHKLSAYWDDRVTGGDTSQWPNALRLRASLGNLNFDTCAPSERRTFVHFSLGDIPVKKFRRHRLQFTMHWQLHSASGENLYSSRTSGYLDSWNESRNVAEAYREVLRRASAKLLNQAEFKAVLLKYKPVAEVAVAPAEQREQAAGPWQTLVDKTSEYIGFYRQSQLSRALALVPQIKLGIAQFYAHEGYWPGELSQINLHEAGLVNNTEGLQRIYLEANGSILLKLDDKFGADARLLIEPLADPGNNLLHWRCTTNIAANIVPRAMNCKPEPG